MADEPMQKPETKAEPTEKAEEKTEIKEGKTQEKAVKTSPKLAKLIEEIEKLSVLELADLVKALEDKFGVVASPMAVAAPVAGSAPAGSDTAGEKSAQATFNVILASTGTNKIGVIKAVREVNQALGLKEAKDLVEAAPKEVVAGVNKETADEAKKKLEAAGATVELK